ncbi:hypothetical protein KAR91_18975 [Candidatus Pacearchaeota archaeon]|nr:hypothetical protein [Candidatus Pacearchaeota archaeon]
MIEGYCKPYNQKMTADACDSKTQYARRATGEAAQKCLGCDGLDFEPLTPEAAAEVIIPETPPKKNKGIVCQDCGIPKEETDKFYPGAGLCRICYMAKYRKDVKTGERVQGDRLSSEYIISVDFRKFPELFEELIDISTKEFRSPGMQILCLIKDKLGMKDES